MAMMTIPVGGVQRTLIAVAATVSDTAPSQDSPMTVYANPETGRIARALNMCRKSPRVRTSRFLTPRAWTCVKTSPTRPNFPAISRARHGLPVGFCPIPRSSSRSSHARGRRRLALALRRDRVSACSGRARTARARSRFRRAASLPASVRGPVDSPPCRRQRPLL